MLHSMTGYGKSTCELNSRKVVVEIRTLNSKNVDLSCKIANIFKEKEMEIRALLTAKLERGKIDFTLFADDLGNEKSIKINKKNLSLYYEQLKNISEELAIPAPEDWMSLLVKLPEVMKNGGEEEEENLDWNSIFKAVNDAIDQTLEFRKQEGEVLEQLFTAKIETIGNLLLQIEPFENERVEIVRNRLESGLEKIDEKLEYDKNRLEQELIYYIEKLDVSEEKIRLKNHLNYFLETMKLDGANGKKLGFIAQEIGREINTLGSKSNHSEMQKIVVMMKDELEQIKEQVLNTL